MNNVKWIGMLLCIIVPVSATVTYNESNVHVFPDNLRQLERVIADSLRTTINVFATPVLAKATLLGLAAAAIIPAVEVITGPVFVIRAILADQTDWRPTFAKTISHEIGHEITLDNIRQIEATMEMIEKKILSMRANNTDMSNRKIAASIIHTNIDKILNSIANKASLFRKYPLLGAPAIIALALSIIFFDPLAKHIIPLESTHPELSCKMSKILQDFRNFAVLARIEKMKVFCVEDYSTTYQRFSTLNGAVFDTMSMPYNRYGYNRTNPPIIRCDKFGRIKKKYCEHTLHMIDDNGGNAYWANPTCLKDYALLLRHRVEEMFPVEILSRLCATPSQPTGFGWLTIKFKYLQVYSTMDGSKCDTFNACDPYIKVFIGDKFQFETPYETNRCCFELDVTFTSGKITKKTLIKIEVWDSDDDDDDLLFTIEGNVDSFLTKGRRFGRVDYRYTNYMETISFWQDQHK